MRLAAAATLRELYSMRDFLQERIKTLTNWINVGKPGLELTSYRLQRTGFQSSLDQVLEQIQVLEAQQRGGYTGGDTGPPPRALIYTLIGLGIGILILFGKKGRG